MTDAHASRHDIYGPIHKAIRIALGDLIARIGRADFSDDAVMADTLAALRAQLRFSAMHLRHEEEYLHPALLARSPEAVDVLERDHAWHRAGFDRLERAMIEVETTPAALRGPPARDLYLAFSAFVAEDLAHMAHEEQVVNPLLQELFTDAELQAIEAAIVASLAPEDAMGALAMMIAAINPDERVAFLGFIRATAPAEAFAAVIEVAAKPGLAANDWADLAEKLGLAA